MSQREEEDSKTDVHTNFATSFCEDMSEEKQSWEWMR